MNLFLMATALQASTGSVFLYCYVGSMITDQFFIYGDIAYESDWHKLPLGLQKYFQLIIADAQRQRVFTGFNVIDLDLTAFTKVVTYPIFIENPILV